MTEAKLTWSIWQALLIRPRVSISLHLPSLAEPAFHPPHFLDLIWCGHS